MKTNEENFQRTVINSCYSCEYVNAPNFENSYNDDDNNQPTEPFSCNPLYMARPAQTLIHPNP